MDVRTFYIKLRINVTVKAGTRQETLQNSSVCQFIPRVAMKGTASLSQEEIQKKLDEFGAKVEIHVTRELTQYSLMFEKDQTNEAVAFMAEIILKPVFDAAQVEAEKAGLYKRITSTSAPFRIANENVHYTAYRV